MTKPEDWIPAAEALSLVQSEDWRAGRTGELMLLFNLDQGWLPTKATTYSATKIYRDDGLGNTRDVYPDHALNGRFWPAFFDQLHEKVEAELPGTVDDPIDLGSEGYNKLLVKSAGIQWDSPFLSCWDDEQGGEVQRTYYQVFGLSIYKPSLLLLIGGQQAIAAPTKVTRRRGRRPLYDGAAFIAQAVAILEYNGGYLQGDWTRQNLESEMAVWREKNWPGQAPERTWINDHIAKAEDRYQAAKTGN